jgi:CheY-like chemotaxis protein
VRAAIQACESGTVLCIDVSDTGIGMREEELALLFHPFTQVDGSSRRKYGGTGLGLTISKRLVQMLGGDLSVQSEPGKGSVFTITIATGQVDQGTTSRDSLASQTAKTPSVPSPNTLSGLRILVAEDGHDNQRILSLLLHKAGAEVVVAENGQEAIQMVEESQAQNTAFDLILMDMQMPVLDGYQATSRLRAAGWTRPIIALTAHAMTTDRQKCLEAGCDDYLPKPVERNKLVACIRSHVAEPRDCLPVLQASNQIPQSDSP